VRVGDVLRAMVGAIGKVWPYSEPELVKVAWALRVTPVGEMDSRVTLELRVDATDADAWTRAPASRPSLVRHGRLAWATLFHHEAELPGREHGFDMEARVSAMQGCSSVPGVVRFRIIDYDTYAPLTSGGTGGLTFELYTRPRRAADPDDVGAPGESRDHGRGRSVGTDCEDCTFPGSSSKTACDRDCFRSGEER